MCMYLLLKSGISHISMGNSAVVVISPTQEENGSNESDSFYNLDESLVDGGWRTGYWKSRYFSS